ncbi:hypothetical protein CBS101457_004961 [Exobasidium rhododendri]|nr:hypothetical protein CBS101457_004961 [Exobasidium rhododendri]
MIKVTDNVAEPTDFAIDELKVVPHSQERRFWIFDSGLRALNFWMFICFLSSYGLGYDGSLFSGLTTLKVWFKDMDNPSGQLLGAVGCSGLIGFVSGPFLAIYFNEKVGRRPSLIAASALSVIFGIITSIKIDNPKGNQILFIVARCCLSTGIGWAMVTAPMLMSEVSHPDHRAIVTCIYLGGFYVGAMVAGWITFGTNSWTSSWAWRFPTLFQIMPSAIQCAVLWWCPESPRWLISNGKTDEARRILTKYHANGQQGSEFVEVEINEITAAIQLEEAGGKASWMEFIRTPANRHRTWISISLGIASQWVGNGVIAYYLPSILKSVGVTNTAQQAKFNGCLAIFNLVIALAAASQAERVGRRPLFFTGAIGMLVSFIIITALSATYARDANPAVGKGVIAFLFIFYGFYDVGITPLQISYPVEVMPYRLRSKGVALNVITEGVAIVFNTFVNPIALESIAWKFYFVYIGVLVLFIVNVYFCYPEVKGRSLEQVAAIFEKTKEGDMNAETALQSRVAQLHHTQPEVGRSVSPSSEKVSY